MVFSQLSNFDVMNSKSKILYGKIL